MNERGYFWGLNSFWTLGSHPTNQPKRQKPVLMVIGSEKNPKRFTPTPAFMIPKAPA